MLACCVRAAHGQGYICAEGGGNEGRGEWAADVFGWILEKRPNARVAILGVRGRDEGLEAVFRRHGAREVVQLAIPGREAAANAEAAASIAAADVVYMRGGDQSRYVLGWDETPVEAAIVSVFRKGGVVGGTSAGAAVLGEAIFDARNDTLLPLQALSDGWHPRLTLSRGFLSLTPGVLFDTHFTERGRIGRLPVMLARCRGDFQLDAVGAGVDYRTALCIGPDGVGEVRGEGTVTFVHLCDASQVELPPGQPPLVTDVRLTQLGPGGRYDLRNRRVLAAGAGRSPTAAVLAQAAAGRNAASGAGARPRMLDGCEPSSAEAGAWRIDDGGAPDALFRARLRLVPGQCQSPDTMVAARTWDDGRSVENSVGGAMLALACGFASRAMLLHCGARYESFGACGVFHAGAGPAASVVVVSCRRPAAGQAREGLANLEGEAVTLPRTGDVVDARLDVLRPGDGFDAATGRGRPRACAADLNCDGAADERDIRACVDAAVALGAGPSGRARLDAVRGGVWAGFMERFVAALLGGCEGGR